MYNFLTWFWTLHCIVHAKTRHKSGKKICHLLIAGKSNYLTRKIGTVIVVPIKCTRRYLGRTTQAEHWYAVLMVTNKSCKNHERHWHWSARCFEVAFETKTPTISKNRVMCSLLKRFIVLVCLLALLGSLTKYHMC